LDTTLTNIFAFSCLTAIAGYFFYIVYYAIGVYELNPFLRPEPLTAKEKNLIKSKIKAVGWLNDNEKHKLYKRIAWFMSKKTFSFKGAVDNRKEIELLISAAGILMTLGMKNYKYNRSVHKIAIYPSDYYSILHKRYHLGEYNLGLKTLVFAADKLKLGFSDDKDNINLAIHEFAHALYFETSGRNSWEALRFQWGFRKLKRVYSNSSKMAVIKQSGYFRDYGETNAHEFFSVLSENYLETPLVFKSKFPELFNLIHKMLNFNFLNTDTKKY